MGVLFRSLATAFVVTCSLAASKRSSGQEESYLPAAVGKRADAAGDALPAEARVRLGTVRFRHTNTFRSVAFTADGKQLATGGWGGACLWDAATGHVIRRYGQELPQAIQGASLSPDGKLIAVGGWSQMEGGGGVYELDSGRRLYRFGTGGIHATGLFSPDGKILAAFPRNDGAVVLFDAATGKELKALERHDLGRGLHMDGDAAFFPNGETLISALGDGMRFWDVASGKLLKHLDPPDGVAEMALSPTGQVIATIGRKTEKDKWGQTVTSRRTEIVLLDAATGKELRRIPAPPLRKPKHIETGPNFIAFSPSGRELVAGCAEGTFRVWDTATGKELRRFLGDCYLHGVAFRPDNRMALIEGHSLRLRDFNTGVDLAPSVGHREEISAMFSPDGSLVATREPYNRSIVLWDARTGRELRRLKSDNEAFRSTVLAPDSKTLLAITYDQEFWIWDVATGTLKHRRKVPGAYVLAQTRDGKTLAVSSDKSIVLLSPADGSELHTLSAEGKNITGMAFTPDGKSLVAWSHPDGKLHHWDLATGRHSSRDFYKLENYPLTSSSRQTVGSSPSAYRTASFCRWSISQRERKFAGSR